MADQLQAHTPGRLPNSARNVLTSRKVQSINKRGNYPDGGNLYLQVARTGTKSWVFRFSQGKRTRTMGLGPIVDVSLAEAREVARECRRQWREGIDPIETRNAARAANREQQAKRVLFADSAAEYMKKHGARKNWSAKHAGQWVVTLETYAYPP